MGFILFVCFVIGYYCLWKNEKKLKNIANLGGFAINVTVVPCQNIFWSLNLHFQQKQRIVVIDNIGFMKDLKKE